MPFSPFECRTNESQSCALLFPFSSIFSCRVYIYVSSLPIFLIPVYHGTHLSRFVVCCLSLSLVLVHMFSLLVTLLSVFYVAELFYLFYDSCYWFATYIHVTSIILEFCFVYFIYKFVLYCPPFYLLRNLISMMLFPFFDCL